MINTSSTRLLLPFLSAFLLICSARAADEPKAGAETILFNGKDTTGWLFRNASAKGTWRVFSEVKLSSTDPKQLVGSGDGASAEAALLRVPIEHGSDLYTKDNFGDCELHIEFMVPKGSNSGVYLMGRYEIQVLDSFGKPNDKLGQGDCGGIYSAKAPSTNATKAPGEWQSFDIIFRAPRFDAAGKKTENARFISVKLNGTPIHENVEVKGPTGGQISNTESPTGPILLQGDHGIVAYRNIRLKAIAP